MAWEVIARRRQPRASRIPARVYLGGKTGGWLNAAAMSAIKVSLGGYVTVLLDRKRGLIGLRRSTSVEVRTRVGVKLSKGGVRDGRGAQLSLRAAAVAMGIVERQAIVLRLEDGILVGSYKEESCTLANMVAKSACSASDSQSDGSAEPMAQP